MRKLLRALLGACALCPIATAAPAGGAPPLDIVNLDFPTLIPSAAASRSQFALSVPHRVSPTRTGRWTTTAGLNYGDRFSYALARSLEQPLLFKVNEFSQTDLECHPASG